MESIRTYGPTLKNAIPLSFPIVAGMVSVLLLISEPSTLQLLVLLVAASAAIGIFVLPAAEVLKIYLFYIFIEGALKIFTNYNPIIHVGSDLLLLAIFGRLIIRASHDNSFRSMPTPPTGWIVPCLMIFWIWVAVQFFNPWGLGVLPSFAAMKNYVMPILLFFITCFLLKPEELIFLPFVLLLLGIAEGSIANLDGYMGEGFVSSLHPRYNQTLGIAFRGDQYRPFGTTHLPGGAAALIAHSVLAVFLVLRRLQIKKPSGEFVHSRLWYLAIAAYFPLSIMTLIFSQVRIFMIRFVIIGLTGLILGGGKKLTSGLTYTIGLGFLLSLAFRSAPIDSDVDADRMERISHRFLSLGSRETWTGARQGAIESMLTLSETTTLGIGLSRVGASSSLWRARIDKDPHFSKKWGFADNVYRAIFTECGLAGLLSYLLLMTAIIVALVKQATYVSLLVAANCIIYILAGWGSEGILYLPDSAFFWTYVGLGLRYNTELAEDFQS